MPLDLARTLSWKSATGDDETMLQQLQANILRPHVRTHLSVLFLNFGDGVQGRAFLRALVTGGLVKSALTHLQEVEAFHSSGTSGTPYVGVGITAGGYQVLGVTANLPSDASFLRGMKDPASRAALHDPAPTLWEAPYRQDVHAVVVIGDASDASVASRRNEVLDLLSPSITVLTEEVGVSQVNSNGDGIEHFGYVDGRSQPLFLDEDIDEEHDNTVGPQEWDPEFHLDRILVPDPAAPNPDVHHGSYFVYRKLEQNVRRFKNAEDDLADALQLTGDDRERAGAMIIGRFEDGTPVTTQRTDGFPRPVTNNFNYDDDGNGMKCPFQAHIRKSNPRGSGGFEPAAQERMHLMARRGQTYGERVDDPNADIPPSERPSGGVGLLFMAFNVNFSQQFDFVQERWVNSDGFPLVPNGHRAPGLDPVIGQGVRPAADYPPIWGAAANRTADAPAQAVTLRGGEYFFMPSLAFLVAL